MPKTNPKTLILGQNKPKLKHKPQNECKYSNNKIKQKIKSWNNLD